MIDLQQTAIQDACQEHGVKCLHVFGSVAEGTDQEGSDIDLLVEFERSGYDGAFDQLMTFKEAMEHLLKRPVDLVIDKPFRNPHFQEEVDRTKRLVYAA